MVALLAREDNPFDLDQNEAYTRWRACKLHHRAAGLEDLLVPVADPFHLSAAELGALRLRIARHGVAVYRSPRLEAASELPRLLGAQLGLQRLDANWLADEDGISRIEVSAAHDDEGAGRGSFIPYTDRAIGWHTDGYYHPEGRRILGMILHCVRPASQGGETSLFDPELAYIALRDESPALVRALEHPQAMIIPARQSDNGVARAAQSGPVISYLPSAAPAAQPGESTPRLHLRYTARTRSIQWRDDALTRAAVARLAALLAGPTPGLVRLRLQAGMGLVGHNVLHARSAFTDDPAAPRLLYRARYLDRVASGEEDAWRNG